jgi:hypothetical protein
MHTSQMNGTYTNGTSPAVPPSVLFNRADGKMRRAPASERLVSASQAFKLLRIPQKGNTRARLDRLGIPIVGTSGAHGGTYLVRLADVDRVKQSLEVKAKTKRKVPAMRKASKRIDTPAPAPTEKPKGYVTLRERMATVEAKIDKLLAAWDLGEAS